MLQRTRDGGPLRLQQFSAGQHDSDALPSTQGTPHTRRKHSTDSMPTCMYSHTTSTCMPGDELCSLYMHTIPLPPVMLRINPFSLRLAPLMPCIALVVIGASLSEPHLVCPAEVLSIIIIYIYRPAVRSPRLTRMVAIM